MKPMKSIKQRHGSALVLSVLIVLAVISLICCGESIPDNSGDTSGEPVISETIIASKTETKASETEEERIPDDEGANQVMGKGIGVNPGRVSWAYNTDAFKWTGSGYWWLEKNFDTDAVEQMMSDTICSLAGEDDIKDALDRLFIDFNTRYCVQAITYKPGEKIAIKVNMNVTGVTNPASSNNATAYFPSPVTVRALLKILVGYGVEPDDITVTDPSRVIPTYMQEYCSAEELKGVRFVYYDNYQMTGSNDAVADLTRPIHWSYDFTQDNWADSGGTPQVNTTYWPKCVTEASYIINLFNLRGHTLAGYTASAKNHFGTVMPGLTNSDGSVTFPTKYRTNPPTWATLHHYCAARDYNSTPKELWDLPKRDMGTYSVLVDLISNRDCGGKTFLYLCDGLVATYHQQCDVTLDERWYSAPFGGGTKATKGWTNSLFASQDPVAIDSVCLDFILAERAAALAVGDNKWLKYMPDGHTTENYLVEAALANDAPSGIGYHDGYGKPVGSLGVFEHWNNSTNKQYSRNLGADEGIELIPIIY